MAETEFNTVYARAVQELCQDLNDSSELWSRIVDMYGSARSLRPITCGPVVMKVWTNGEAVRGKLAEVRFEEFPGARQMWIKGSFLAEYNDNFSLKTLYASLETISIPAYEEYETMSATLRSCSIELLILSFPMWGSMCDQYQMAHHRVQKALLARGSAESHCLSLLLVQIKHCRILGPSSVHPVMWFGPDFVPSALLYNLAVLHNNVFLYRYKKASGLWPRFRVLRDLGSSKLASCADLDPSSDRNPLVKALKSRDMWSISHYRHFPAPTTFMELIGHFDDLQKADIQRDLYDSGGPFSMKTVSQMLAKPGNQSFSSVLLQNSTVYPGNNAFTNIDNSYDESALDTIIEKYSHSKSCFPSIAEAMKMCGSAVSAEFRIRWALHFLKQSCTEDSFLLFVCIMCGASPGLSPAWPFVKCLASRPHNNVWFKRTLEFVSALLSNKVLSVDTETFEFTTKNSKSLLQSVPKFCAQVLPAAADVDVVPRTDFEDLMAEMMRSMHGLQVPTTYSDYDCASRQQLYNLLELITNHEFDSIDSYRLGLSLRRSILRRLGVVYIVLATP